MGRRSVWSHPEIRELSQRFVTAADEVWRLQTEDDPDCRFFRSMADQGHYKRKGGTRQGIYVMTPSGKLLGSRNSHNAEHVLTMLRSGLEQWQELPRSDRQLPPELDLRPVHRWEMSLPVDGLILTSIKRDLAPELDPTTEPKRPFNRDPIWFTRSEARGLLPTSLELGAQREVPDVIVERLARFHLVDNVRGQTLPYATSELIEARLTSEIVSRQGALVGLKLSGSSKAETDGRWRLGENYWKPRREWPRGIETRLLGQASYDTQRGEFVEFKLVAQGMRWGRTSNNGRARNPAPGPIGILIELAPDTPARRVAPTFINVYDADWVQAPSE